MTDTANPLIPGPGKLRHALSFVRAWLQNMDYSDFDYTMDRIERLEREVGHLKEELRQIRKIAQVVSHNDSAAGLKH